MSKVSIKKTNCTINLKSNIRSNKAVIVLGMHRSGTSLVSGVLHILGVNMGITVRDNDQFNTKGYFEDARFKKINKKILSSIGARWDNPHIKRGHKPNKRLTNNIREITTKEGVWGWKDPRTVFTLDYYIHNIKNPCFILCFRNPQEIAKSLKERDGFNIERGLILTNIYNQQITKIMLDYPSIPRLYISYETITADPKGQTKKIARFLNIKLTDSKTSLVNKFITSPTKIQKEKVGLQREYEKKLLKKIKSLQNELQEINNNRAWKIIKKWQKLKAALLN